MIIAVASGKGGVGKTSVVANLGTLLAQSGKTVIVVDLDLGGANLHTTLGIRNKHSGIGHFILRQVPSLEQLVIPTDTEKLFFIPGDSLFPGLANLPYFMKIKIVKQLNDLVADYIIIDLGSGTNYNTIDFYLAADIGITVVAPEPTSVLNAYAFLKTALYRTLFRSFPRKSDERTIIKNFASQKIEGSAASFKQLIGAINEYNTESGMTVKTALENFYPRVILNMGRRKEDIHIGGKLREICSNNLSIHLEFIGYLQYEPDLYKSIVSRKPFCTLLPNSEYCQNLGKIVTMITNYQFPGKPQLYSDNEDLLDLENQG